MSLFCFTGTSSASVDVVSSVTPTGLVGLGLGVARNNARNSTCKRSRK